MRIIKKLQKKMPLFSKIVVHFEFFLQMRWNVKGGKQDFSNKVIVLNATSVVILQYKQCQENKFQNILYNWSTKANLRRKSLICSP